MTLQQKQEQCNNVTFGVESFGSRSHVTTTNYSFTSSSLISIMILDSSSSTPLSIQHLVPLHLRHKVGGTSIYKLEGYSIECILDIIQDEKGEHESNDKDLGR